VGANPSNPKPSVIYSPSRRISRKNSKTPQVPGIM
jgi:hypothetical protein